MGLRGGYDEGPTRGAAASLRQARQTPIDIWQALLSQPEAPRLGRLRVLIEGLSHATGIIRNETWLENPQRETRLRPTSIERYVHLLESDCGLVG